MWQTECNKPPLLKPRQVAPSSAAVKVELQRFRASAEARHPVDRSNGETGDATRNGHLSIEHH